MLKYIKILDIKYLFIRFFTFINKLSKTIKYLLLNKNNKI